MEHTGRAAVAELVGTFAIVFFGGGAVVYGADLLGVALATGLTVAAMVSLTAHLSGGVFNPAIQVALWVTGKMSTARSAVYLVAQLGGAVGAALALRWVAGPVFDGVTGVSPVVPAVAPGLATGTAVVVEAIITFFLVWSYFATLVDERGPFTKIAGLAVGFTATAGILTAAALTGAAMNPARWFGPALAGGDWTNWWVWIVGPIGGAIVGGVAYWYLFLYRQGPTTP